MRTMRGKNLQLSGIELVLPTVLCIEGRAGKGERTTVTIGYASRYADSIVGPLAAEWLSRQFHCRLSERGRGAEGDLAAEAFYDKLASEFREETAFLAAIVSPHHAPFASIGGDHRAPAGAARRDAPYRPVTGDVLRRFITGRGLVRWRFEGRMRAFMNAKAAAAQVSFDPLPGGIELSGNDSSARSAKRAQEAVAWCGFGIPIRDTAELVLMLRNELAGSRHPSAQAMRAANA